MTAGSKEISKLENENIGKEVSYLQITVYRLRVTVYNFNDLTISLIDEWLLEVQCSS